MPVVIKDFAPAGRGWSVIQLFSCSVVQFERAGAFARLLHHLPVGRWPTVFFWRLTAAETPAKTVENKT
ncbi:hypothetical protein A4R26_03195 [Niastella populi]|uniref:Uncharacterized protein n=1 Tax=Niastella populi TaxID=550983 RepID=A0A1V9FJT4_9BACT|nr:hypothetical protein A4R26_03195 [Niastella populi]